MGEVRDARGPRPAARGGHAGGVPGGRPGLVRGLPAAPYKAALRTAIEEDAYNSARQAYTALRGNPFSRSRATGLMQQFWEQRALRYAQVGGRDESLLSCLQGLGLRDSERLRRRARNLVGPDYERLRLTLRHADRVKSVAFSPDGRTLATGSREGMARLWDAHSGKLLASLAGHQGDVDAVAFSRDGRILASGAGDGVRLWDAVTGELLAAPFQHPGIVYSLAFSPDDRVLATGSMETAYLWDMRSGKPLELPLRHGGAVRSVAFSPDGRTLAMGTRDNNAQLWDLRSGKPQASPPLRQRSAFVLAVAFSPDGRGQHHPVLERALRKAARAPPRAFRAWCGPWLSPRRRESFSPRPTAG